MLLRRLPKLVGTLQEVMRQVGLAPGLGAECSTILRVHIVSVPAYCQVIPCSMRQGGRGPLRCLLQSAYCLAPFHCDSGQQLVVTCTQSATWPCVWRCVQPPCCCLTEPHPCLQTRASLPRTKPRLAFPCAAELLEVLDPLERRTGGRTRLPAWPQTGCTEMTQI